MLRTYSIALLCSLLTLLIGCGQKNEHAETEQLTLILDYLPGPIHAGFYAAQARGDYEAAGLDVVIQTPSATSDTLRLMAAGQADLGIVPLIDFFHLSAQGREMKLLMAVVQTPLNAIITNADAGIKSPLDLEGRSIGTTGILGDEIVLQALLKANGGLPSNVETINLGFNTIQALASGRVDAAFGFWNAEGIQYQESHDALVLRSFEQGIPAYPELVLFTSDARIAEKASTIRRFIEITTASHEELLKNPEEALVHFANSVDGYEVDSARPFYEILLPVFKHQADKYGLIDRQTLLETMDWLSESGFPQYQLPVDTLIAPDLTVITP